MALWGSASWWSHPLTFAAGVHNATLNEPELDGDQERLGLFLGWLHSCDFGADGVVAIITDREHSHPAVGIGDAALVVAKADADGLLAHEVCEFGFDALTEFHG